MPVILYSDENQCDFAINILRKRDVKRGIELIREGVSAWYQAANLPEDIESTDHFSAEEVKDFYWAGYAEPSIELLERYRIPYRSVDMHPRVIVNTYI